MSSAALESKWWSVVVIGLEKEEARVLLRFIGKRTKPEAVARLANQIRAALEPTLANIGKAQKASASR